MWGSQSDKARTEYISPDLFPTSLGINFGIILGPLQYDWVSRNGKTVWYCVIRQILIVSVEPRNRGAG